MNLVTAIIILEYLPKEVELVELLVESPVVLIVCETEDVYGKFPEIDQLLNHGVGNELLRFTLM